MKKKFLVNIIFLISLNLLIKPFWIFGIDRTVQNLVGSADYGLYFALFNFSFLFSFLLDFGLTNYNNHNVSKDKDFIASNFGKIAGLKLTLAGVYILITLVAGFSLDYGSQLLLLAALAGNQLLLSFILFLRSNISGLQIFWLDSIISVLDRTIVIILCALLIWGGLTESPFQVEWLAYTQTISYLITLLFCLIVLLAKTDKLIELPKTLFIKNTLQASFPYALIILFMTLYFRVDAVMLEQILADGDYQAGIYAQGYRFLDMINNFMFLFVGILFPLLSREISKQTKVESLISFSVSILIIPAIFIVYIALNFNQQLIELSYDETSHVSAMVLRILLLSYLPLVFTQIYGTVLTAAGSLKIMVLWSGIAFVLNILLNGLLIPVWGPVGAAWASLGSQFIMALGCFITCRYVIDIKPTQRDLKFILALLLIFIATHYIGQGLTPVAGSLVALTVTIICFVIYLVSHGKQLLQLKSLNK